ncbi:hypothetical protein K438DRAFT_1804339 [Mycena galopus ATCC 62051]|nr:hypothetical protein K438DRAFT_1804339 [Mycena galopus ATCC 62051]
MLYTHTSLTLPFDLEPVYAAWTPCSRFLGDPKKDQPVDDWLEEIKTGCVKQNVPKEYWHTCGQHFMGDQAKARLAELKKVMAQIHGGNYRWNWKKFKVAMRNMSCHKTEAVKVPAGPFWWMPKSTKKETEPEEEEHIICDEPIEILSRSDTLNRAATTRSFWPIRKNSKELAVVDEIAQRPVPRKAMSEGTVVLNREVSKPLPAIPMSGDEGTTVRAPAWLLNAATALDFLHSEHPRVMNTLSAILIVAAAGAVLASSTAHAVGAIAIGSGTGSKPSRNEIPTVNTWVK